MAMLHVYNATRGHSTRGHSTRGHPTRGHPTCEHPTRSHTLRNDHNVATSFQSLYRHKLFPA